ncbi:MAG TPA: flagellar biosynthetic protein FliR, partial [Tianweitania sediminis]|nr:flagellar biosynthetic protein FliR [Tianweitania sediminis]
FHHEVVRALVESYQVIPVETLFDPQGALVDLGDTMRDAFMVMLRLGSPFIAYAILVNVAIGFVNKLTPQIPVYFISLPFVIAGGMLLLYFGASTFLTLFGDAFMPVTIGR